MKNANKKRKEIKMREKETIKIVINVEVENYNKMKKNCKAQGITWERYKNNMVESCLQRESE